MSLPNSLRNIKTRAERFLTSEVLAVSRLKRYMSSRLPTSLSRSCSPTYSHTTLRDVSRRGVLENTRCESTLLVTFMLQVL